MSMSPIQLRSAVVRLLLAVLLWPVASPAAAEDGYDLWLRYRPIEAPQREAYAEQAAAIWEGTPSPTLTIARQELERGLAGMLGSAPALTRGVTRPGTILLGTPRSLPQIGRLRLPLGRVGYEGYVI